MAGSALKKIVARVKQLRKKHPNAKYRTLQKQAGKEFKSGKLKGIGKVKKARVKKATAPKKRKRAVKAKRSVIRRVVVVQKIGKVRRRRKAAKKPAPRRRSRVGAMSLGSMLIPVLGLGILGYAAYKMMQPQVQSNGLLSRNNTAAAQGQSNVLAWAAAAGIVGSALSKIIDSLNNSDDETVAAAGSSPGAAQDYWSNFLSGD